HPDELDHLAHGTHGDPHRIFGPHVVENHVVIRTLRPLADRVEIVYGSGSLADAQRVDATHTHNGVWTAVLETSEVPDYRIAVTYGETTEVVDDPYRFLPQVGELALHLIAEGRHEELWRVLGANIKRYDGPLGEVNGTSFAVWAP